MHHQGRKVNPAVEEIQSQWLQQLMSSSTFYSLTPKPFYNCLHKNKNKKKKKKVRISLKDKNKRKESMIIYIYLPTYGLWRSM